MNQQFLFICGCPRSGTTAITSLLNRHSRIIVGMERYKYVFKKNKLETVNKSLFYPENFLDIQPHQTNIIPHPGNQWEFLYESLAEKIKARNSNLDELLVGDKLPFAFELYDEIENILGSVKWIFMLRNLESVAASYNSRANNIKDRWPLTNDYKKAVLDWNRSVILTYKHFKKNPSSLFICEYEELFSYKPPYLSNLLNFLEVDPEEDILEVYRNMTRDWASRSTNSQKLDEYTKSYLQEHSKQQLSDSLVKQFRIQHNKQKEHIKNDNV